MIGGVLCSYIAGLRIVYGDIQSRHPLLIFAVAAIDAAAFGLPVRPHLLLLGGIAAAALVLAPWTAAAALRQALA